MTSRWLKVAVCVTALVLAPTRARADDGDPEMRGTGKLPTLELRAGGFYGHYSPPSTDFGALLFGLYGGGGIWVTPGVALEAEGGVELGGLFRPSGTDTTVVLAGVAGPKFLVGGTHRKGTMLSIGWAPRLFANLQGRGVVASAAGVEAALRVGLVKVPIWLISTNDGATIVGASFALAY